MTMQPRTKQLLKVQVSENLLHLVIYTTEFRLRNQYLTVATIQNIQSELEEKEMEAWQKLIRVLTHEIMNSITPISSLAKTVDELLMQQSDTQLHQLKEQEFIDIRDAVNTIQKRSEGLIHFVEAYRKLTRIPKPDFRQIEIKDTISRVIKLMEREFKDQNIELIEEYSAAALNIFADPEQIEQVLLNLLKNSSDAMSKKRKKNIWLRTKLDEQGRKIVEISDNGSGIAPEARDQIFIPFFTTKKTGSGIGLSLCRQIMRQHLGSITVFSKPKSKTTFRLIFP
jgi:signal transduction histidine kinase